MWILKFVLGLIIMSLGIKMVIKVLKDYESDYADMSRLSSSIIICIIGFLLILSSFGIL